MRIFKCMGCSRVWTLEELDKNKHGYLCPDNECLEPSELKEETDGNMHRRDVPGRVGDGRRPDMERAA